VNASSLCAGDDAFVPERRTACAASMPHWQPEQDRTSGGGASSQRWLGLSLVALAVGARLLSW
jgi:hypothetical protein